MKKVDLNIELKDLNDNSIGNAGQLVASLLMSEVKGDAIKFFDWAVTLNKKESVMLDASDFSKLKALVSETEKITVLAKAPILKHLDSIKESDAVLEKV